MRSFSVALFPFFAVPPGFRCAAVRFFWLAGMRGKNGEAFINMMGCKAQEKKRLSNHNTTILNFAGTVLSMMLLNQLLVGGVALLGIALGVLLRLLVPEEAAKGRAYFTMLERVLLAAAFVPAVALQALAQQWLVVALLAMLLVVVL